MLLVEPLMCRKLESTGYPFACCEEGLLIKNAKRVGKQRVGRRERRSGEPTQKGSDRESAFVDIALAGINGAANRGTSRAGSSSTHHNASAGGW